MFSSGQPLRKTLQPGLSGPYSLLQSSTKSFAINWDTKDVKKKIETKNSLLSESIKNSIISDSAYNTNIYEWRKQQTAPILKVVQIARTSEIDAFTGLSLTHKTIRPEIVHSNLATYNQFSKEQLLLIFKNMLDGHQAIFKKMKATSVSLEKSVITKNGQVKVWVNQKYERNQISGQILSKQQQIGKRIFQTLAFLSSNNQIKISDFIQYVESSIKKSGKWTFASLKAMIKSYSDCLRIKIPKTISFDKKHEKKIVLTSMVQNIQNPKLSLFRPRLKSFQGVINRNVQSSLNYNLQSKRRSFLTSKCSQKDSSQIISPFLSKNATNKSIQQKQTAPTIQSLFSKSKHTNSISTLTNQQDPIIQKYEEHNKQNISLNNYLILNPSHQCRKIPSINDILSHKIGISPLPQVGDEESSSPTARNFYKQEQQEDQTFQISPQFNIKIQKNTHEFLKPSKESSISTTNQTNTSGIQFCFAKKFKESHLTINLQEERKNKNEEFRTASRDRFKDTQAIARSQQPKKAIGSCTNWSNEQESGNLNTLLEQMHYSKMFASDQMEKEEQKKQIISRLEIYKQTQQKITPIKAGINLMSNYLNTQLGLLSQLRSQQQLESHHENTDKNSSYGSSQNSIRKVRMPIEQKILQLINLNKRLVISTYMESGSQKKINRDNSPDREKEKRLRDIQQTLSQLVKANLMQEQILEQNCWTKRLQNLLGIEQNEMKESISFGAEEANALLREIKLSRLGKWGRDIGKSVIPE